VRYEYRASVPIWLYILSDVSIDFVDYERLEGSLEKRRTIFLSTKSGAGWHYILIISGRGASIIGQFFSRHLGLPIHE
jgi:hypothetical protein